MVSPDWLEKLDEDTPCCRKIKGCCEQALKDELEWVWIDTCCIDKSSSAELSESINSMYRWYQAASVCYVYMSDVAASGPMPPRMSKQDFCKSKWFSRGWTLQELIAPPYLEFYASGWIELGTRISLLDWIQEATGINRSVLASHRNPFDLSIGERMSWASERETTREEDMAYCLLGIFGVNMPLLYGEGRGAFLRLQEEILKQQEDYTILCWCVHGLDGPRYDSGVLALKTRDFAELWCEVDSGNMIEESSSDWESESSVSGLEASGSKSASSADLRSMTPPLPSPYFTPLGWKDVYCSVAQSHRSQLPMEVNIASALFQQPSPPHFTSRGLKMSLFVKKHQYHEGGYLAWTWCCWARKNAKQLICLMLDENLRFRTRPSTLKLVPAWEIKSFQVREVFLDVSSSRSLHRFPPVSHGSREHLRVYHDQEQLKLQGVFRFSPHEARKAGVEDRKAITPECSLHGTNIFSWGTQVETLFAELFPENKHRPTGNIREFSRTSSKPDWIRHLSLVLVLLFRIEGDSNVTFPLIMYYPGDPVGMTSEEALNFPLSPIGRRPKNEDIFCIPAECVEGPISNYGAIASNWRSRLRREKYSFQDRLIKQIDESRAVLISIKRVGSRRSLVLELVGTGDKLNCPKQGN